jgi:glycosyltransferase involved in cell wall biosynthesis
MDGEPQSPTAEVATAAAVTAAAGSLHLALFTTVDISAMNGPSIHVLSIVNGLAAQGHRVSLVVPRPPGAPVMAVAPSVTFVATPPTRRLGIPGAAASLLMLRALWRARRADAIYVRSSPGTLPLAAAARLLASGAVVVETNGWFADELGAMGYRDRIVGLARRVQVCEGRLADRVRVVTDNIKAKFVAAGVAAERIAVIPTGTDTRNFLPLDRSAACHHLGLAPDRRRLVFIGNLWPAIDLVTVFRAMDLLRRRGVDLELVVVGDGTGRAALEQAAAEILGRPPPVRFLGSRGPSEANVALTAADVAVAPFSRARNESTGLSPLKIRDYAAAGAVTVATAVSGIRELGDEPWLMLAEAEDPASFASAIERALAVDAASARRRAREYAEARFDWSYVVSEIVFVVADACRQRKARGQPARR